MHNYVLEFSYKETQGASELVPWRLRKFIYRKLMRRDGDSGGGFPRHGAAHPGGFASVTKATGSLLEDLY